MAQQHREQWGTRAGFLLAAIGSAIGLGNIWRFPYVAYDNGGGAFLLPYLIALLTAGIPLLILEYTIGHRFRGSPPLAFHRMSRPATAIGWWQVAICFVIATYYAVIVAWAIRFTGFSVGQQWGDDPDGFLFGEFLQVSDEPGVFSSFVPGVALPLIAVWAIVLAVLLFGVRRGIEWANKIFIRCWSCSSASSSFGRCSSTARLSASTRCSPPTGRPSRTAASGSRHTARSSSRSRSASAS